NGSGKSNLVSFFSLLNHMMTGSLQRHVAENGTAENFLHFGSKHTPEFSARLTFGNGTGEDAYSFTLKKSVQDTLFFSEECVSKNGVLSEAQPGNKESFLTDGEALGEGKPAVSQILSACKVFQFHDTSASSYIRNTASLDNDRSLMGNGGNLAAYLYMLKTTEKYSRYYRRIAERIRFMMPQFGDFVLEPQARNNNYIRLRWTAKDEPDYIFGPEQLSDGSIRFMALATLLLQPPELLPKVVVLDEPELGLHPRAVDMLAHLIKTAAQNCQIVVATQSPRMLDSFTAEDIIVAEYNGASRSSTYTRLNPDELSDWLERFSLSELWEKNVLGGQP
ncbi:MAG: AAA family ATPase, partial [Treponema sp.]|nr:AAA family ATPase [Treponema sp.]